MHYKHRVGLGFFPTLFYASSPPDLQRLLRLSSDTLLIGTPLTTIFWVSLSFSLNLSELLPLRTPRLRCSVSWGLIFFLNFNSILVHLYIRFDYIAFDYRVSLGLLLSIVHAVWL